MNKEKCCQRNQALYDGVLQSIIRNIRNFVCHIYGECPGWNIKPIGLDKVHNNYNEQNYSTQSPI